MATILAEEMLTEVLPLAAFETGRSSRMSRMSPDPELMYVAPWIIFEREEPAK